MKRRLSFLTLPGPWGEELLERETSVSIIASFNIGPSLRGTRCIFSVYLPVPFLVFQPSLTLWHSFTNIWWTRLHVAVGWLVVPIEDAAHSLKFIICQTRAKGSSWLLPNVSLLPQCGSTI